MSVARARLARVEALIIALMFFVSAMVLAVRADKVDLPSLGELSVPTTTSAAPSKAPAVASNQALSSERPGSMVPVLFQRRAGSSPQHNSQPQPSPTVRPSPSPSSTPAYAWTNCHPTKSGGLTCGGWRGTFKCTTARTGDTACNGTNVSFSCTTDTSTGARQCESGSDSWRCVTNADTGGTACAGTKGSYSCSSTPSNGADEQCTGSQNFGCYDDAHGRECGAAIRFNRDCYFEPIFGAYCRT
jgi:hypothetical protein